MVLTLIEQRMTSLTGSGRTGRTDDVRGLFVWRLIFTVTSHIHRDVVLHTVTLFDAWGALQIALTLTEQRMTSLTNSWRTWRTGDVRRLSIRRPSHTATWFDADNVVRCSDADRTAYDVTMLTFDVYDVLCALCDVLGRYWHYTTVTSRYRLLLTLEYSVTDCWRQFSLFWRAWRTLTYVRVLLTFCVFYST